MIIFSATPHISNTNEAIQIKDITEQYLIIPIIISTLTPKDGFVKIPPSITNSNIQ